MNINTLYDRALQGNSGAEHHLFESLRERFRYVANQRVWDADEAEDLAQDALVVILEQYREVSIESSFSAWAHKVLQHKILNHVQRKKRRKRMLSRRMAEDIVPRRSIHDDEQHLKRQLLICLRKVAGVNTRYARILNLSYQGYKTDEICKKMGITATNLYVMLFRSRSMLRLCLEEGRIQ